MEKVTRLSLFVFGLVLIFASLVVIYDYTTQPCVKIHYNNVTVDKYKAYVEDATLIVKTNEITYFYRLPSTTCELKDNTLLEASSILLLVGVIGIIWSLFARRRY